MCNECGKPEHECDGHANEEKERKEQESRKQSTEKEQSH